jgi:hypothetical protein
MFSPFSDSNNFSSFLLVFSFTFFSPFDFFPIGGFVDDELVFSGPLIALVIGTPLVSALAAAIADAFE